MAFAACSGKGISVATWRSARGAGVNRGAFRGTRRTLQYCRRWGSPTTTEQTGSPPFDRRLLRLRLALHGSLRLGHRFTVGIVAFYCLRVVCDSHNFTPGNRQVIKKNSHHRAVSSAVIRRFNRSRTSSSQGLSVTHPGTPSCTGRPAPGNHLSPDMSPAGFERLPGRTMSRSSPPTWTATRPTRSPESPAHSPNRPPSSPQQSGTSPTRVSGPANT